MSFRRIITLISVASIVFTVSYGVAAKAWPTPYWTGYFTGVSDSDKAGNQVFPTNSDTPGCSAGGGFSIPSGINNWSAFVNFIGCKLNSGNNYAPYVAMEKYGAAFIIQTMLGDGGPRITSTADSRFTDWSNRVKFYSDQGWINWSGSFSYYYNSYFTGNGSGGGPIDDAYWPVSGSSSTNTFTSDIAIIFNNGSSAPYAIRRQCGNPLGSTAGSLAIASPWAAVGSTTVTDNQADPGDTPTDINTRPGDTLHFVHAIQNVSASPANSIWYATMGQANPVNFTGQYYNNLTLSGSPALTRSDSGYLNYQWDVNSPGPGVNADFSARWTKTEYFTPGTYNFQTITDDGVRLYVDGNLLIDDWNSHAPTSHSAGLALTEGNHTITMEYFDSGGPATAIMLYYLGEQPGANGFGYSPGQIKYFNEDVTVPISAAPNSKICRRVLWDWKNGQGIGDFAPYLTWGWGPSACATVGGNFNLVPTVTATTPGGGLTAQQGDQVTFRYKVQNTGSSTSASASCTITGSQPGGTAGPPSTTCPQTFAAGATVEVTSSPQVITIGSEPAGSKICRTLSVNPGGPSGGSVSSAQVCVLVAKTPYVHFFGGDVWAGGGFTQADGTCTTNANAKITTVSNVASSAGSTDEYGTFALSDVNKFGSGAMPLFDSTNFSDLGRRLVFANNTTNLGRFGAPQHCIDDRSSAYNSSPAISGTVNLATQPSGSWHAAGNITLAGTLPAGSKQVYLVDGNVTINGNIYYTGANPTYSSPSQIPSLVIIAKGDINVDQSVANLDGIYITRGTFFTCYQKPSPPTTSTCNVQLTLNGSVIANSLDLYRTFGGDGSTVAQRQLPAEIFNLSPEMFLNNALNTTANTSITTSDSRELPPRF